ncbi:MAG TPA: choice-of-anchor D domain-containing protein [Acidobacteriaceae bacterium]|nr:choice-of-anchor D domain-containing protein [Acidobacteriaceae bacterium]
MGVRRSIFFAGFLLGSFVPLTAQVPARSNAKIVGSNLPIVFEPAPAAQDSSVAIIGRVAGGTVAFRPSAIEIYTGHQPGPFAITFDGAQPTPPSAVDRAQSQTNYLLGSDPALWRTHVANYARVVYLGLYKDIDAVFYGNGSHLEHDFIVKPGADYRQIRMRLPANSQAHIESDGALTMTLAGMSLRMDAPSIYQNVNGQKQPRDGAFHLQSDGSIGFTVAHYDPRFDLVIDPVLDFSTYLSPLGSDGLAIATDANGNSYVTGTGSLGFPVTSGAFSSCATCTANNGVTFISKLSSDGSKLIYSTVLGGNSFAQPTGIAVDASGDAIVSGWTGATDFPTKSGQPILPQNNNYVGFLVSLSPDGSSLNYGTLLSSGPAATQSAMTYATAVALDSTGNAYVTGETGGGFFISSGALNHAVTGNSSYNSFDVYLAKFSPAGALVYSAVLGTADPQNGGGGPIGASAIAVDAAGDAYVAGQAGTLWPITSGAYLSTIAGSQPYATPFVIKVAPDAKSVLYSTYLDYAYVVKGLSVLGNGNVFITGDDAGKTYPTTSNAYLANNGSGSSSFLTELNASGSALVYSTMVCATCTVNGMAIDSSGNIWLASQTSDAQFPLKLPLQSIMASPMSVVSEFDPTGQNLEFSTFLGGPAAGYASSVAIDPNLRVHVSGAAQYGMYTTSGAYAGSVPVPGAGYTSSTYAYVALIDPAVSSAGLCLNPNYAFNLTAPVGSSTERQLTITSCGAQPLSITNITTPSGDFSIPSAENGCLQNLAVGQSCTVSVHFAPSVSGNQSSTLTIASNSPIPAVLPLTGTGTTAPVMTLSATSLTFGPQLVGTTSAAQTITISNTGNATLNGIGFGQISADEPIFPLTYTCGYSLAPNTSCTFSVAFKPSATGTTSATVLVENSSNLPLQQVSLSGTSPKTPFSIGTQTAGSTSNTVTAGVTANYALSITTAGGYTGTVNMSCTGLPANASCGFTPANLSLTSGTPTNFTLSISTETTQTAALLHTGEWGTVLGLLLVIPFKRNRKRAAALVCFGTLLFATAISGCSGGGGSGTTTPQPLKVAPGTYTIQLTASDASSNQATEAITLVVQ